MRIKIPRDLFDTLTEKFWAAYGVNKYEYTRRNYGILALDTKDIEDVKVIQDALEAHKDMKSARRVFRNIELWFAIKVGGEEGVTKARTVRGFLEMLEVFLKKTPGHRVYKFDSDRDAHFCYYVSELEYHSAETHYGHITPEHIDITFVYSELDVIKTVEITLWREHCVGLTVIEALLKLGYYAENDDLRLQYLDEKKRYTEVTQQIGKQFLATGTATNDLDGNKDYDEDSWWRDTSTYVLDKEGTPARVVVDLFRESAKEKDDRDKKFKMDFWGDLASPDTDDPQESDNDEESDDEENPLPIYEHEIPIHPLVACFNFATHMRLKIHVSQLEEYKYNKDVARNLVLPEENKDLIDTLLSYGSEYKDVIAQKGKGIIVLCAGIPGTGKTLTAEVYAEASGKPLYTVQCSQLGIDAEQLEDNLLKVFARARRWGAILLMDEADVYLSKRGTSVQQNAIVGVFLRTMEYYGGVMFLTTNLGDMVDDAVASRCIAKINYQMPNVEDQKKIWKILSTVAEVEIKDKEIDKIVGLHNKCTGRDIKNLLKLAIMISEKKKKPITAETISYVKRFKATQEA